MLHLLGLHCRLLDLFHQPYHIAMKYFVLLNDKFYVCTVQPLVYVYLLCFEWARLKVKMCFYFHNLHGAVLCLPMCAVLQEI